MRHVFMLFLMVALMFTFTACGSETAPTDSNKGTPSASENVTFK